MGDAVMILPALFLILLAVAMAEAVIMLLLTLVDDFIKFVMRALGLRR